MKISKYIGDLLFEYECIVIPDFGGFIAKGIPAKINQIQNHFTPPTKEIVFNVHLKTNDGLLINHIAKSEKITYTDARIAVERFVQRCHKELKNGKRINFQRVGKVYSDDEGNLQFEPDTTQNYFADSYGLKTFISPPIKRSHIKPLNVKKPKDRKIKAESKKKTKKSNTKIGEPKYIKINVSAIIIIVAICAVTYLKYGTIKDYYNNYSSFIPYFFSPNDLVVNNIDHLPIDKMLELDNKLSPNSEAKKEEEMMPYVDPSIQMDEKINPEDSLADKKGKAHGEEIAYRSEKVKKKEELPNKTVKSIEKQDIISKTKKPIRQRLILNDNDAQKSQPSTKKATPKLDDANNSLTADKVNSDKFLLIAGSFSNELNALNKVKELKTKGFVNAEIAGQNKYGSYRVCFNRFNNVSDANAQLAIIRKEESASAWLLSI